MAEAVCHMQFFIASEVCINKSALQEEISFKNLRF